MSALLLVAACDALSVRPALRVPASSCAPRHAALVMNVAANAAAINAVLAAQPEWEVGQAVTVNTVWERVVGGGSLSDDDFDDPFLGGKPMNINQNRAPAARGATGAIEDSAPKTDKEFEALAGLINGKLSQYEGKKGHLVCLKALLKSATAPMSTDECKDLASFVSVLSNAKIQADRDKDKGKKKGAPKKKTIVASKQSANDYGDDYDDFGDF